MTASGVREGERPRVSVVVPVYNAAHVLEETVPALLDQDYAAELLFVDDGSTDATPEVLRGLTSGAANARILTHAQNRGRAAARNTGLAEATGAVVLFFDADVRPAPDCVRQHALLYRDPEVVGAVSNPTLVGIETDDPYGQYLQTRRGAAGVGPGRPLPFKYFIIGYTSVRARALEEVGGFDDELSYGEDLDLAYRLWQRYPRGLRFEPAARVAHLDHGTLEGRRAKLRVFGRENLPRLLRKHPGLAGPAGLRFVLSSGHRSGPPWQLFHPSMARLVHATLRWLPRPLRPFAVRYVLASAVVEGYRSAPNPSRAP